MKTRLHFYFALLLIGSFNWGFSSVVYTGNNPLYISSNGMASVDLNNDGTPEFDMQDLGFGGSPTFGTFFDPNDINFVTWSANSNWDVFKPLSLNTAIDANSGFHAQGDCNVNPMWDPNLFPVFSYELVGVRFKINGNIHYGWMRFMLDDINGMLEIIDYAYEDQSGVAIAAGDKGAVTGLNLEVPFSKLQLFPNPASTNVTISLEDNVEQGIVKIYSITGSEVLNTTISQNKTINVQSLEPGNYLVAITSKNLSLTRSLFIR